MTGVIRRMCEDRCTLRVLCDNEGRDGSCAAASKGMPEVARKVGDRRRKGSVPPQVAKEAEPWKHLDFRLLVLRTVRK